MRQCRSPIALSLDESKLGNSGVGTNGSNTSNMQRTSRSTQDGFNPHSLSKDTSNSIGNQSFQLPDSYNTTERNIRNSTTSQSISQQSQSQSNNTSNNQRNSFSDHNRQSQLNSEAKVREQKDEEIAKRLQESYDREQEQQEQQEQQPEQYQHQEQDQTSPTTSPFSSTGAQSSSGFGSQSSEIMQSFQHMGNQGSLSHSMMFQISPDGQFTITRGFPRNHRRVMVPPGMTNMPFPPFFLQRHAHGGPMLDPDSMSYEDLLALGDQLGYVKKGTSPETISQLPTSKFQLPTFKPDKEEVVKEENESSSSKGKPKEKEKEKKERKNPSGNDSNAKNCCFCMEDFQNGDDIRRLPCFHIFHQPEIDKWLLENNTCPICKTLIN